MKKNDLLKISLILFLFFVTNFLKAQQVVGLQQGKPTSIRGLSVVDNQVAWISGSKGYIAMTTDGGKTWNWSQVKGYEKADFRDIEAFSAKEAVIMSSGTPALVLKTVDGGLSWQEKYKNADTTFFFDAMKFADHRHGYILGDPIDHQFLLMETKDGGETWDLFKNRPDALPGEAAFAASGTCLRADKTAITIVSGGGAARELMWTNGNKTTGTWTTHKLPFPCQKPSQGGFSVAYSPTLKVFVGGDYANDRRTDSLSCYIKRPERSAAFRLAEKNLNGFQSCVEYITGDTFLSTGTPGSNITTDGGKTWTKIDGTSYNVCRKAKQGNLVLLAGNGGKIAVLKTQ